MPEQPFNEEDVVLRFSDVQRDPMRQHRRYEYVVARGAAANYGLYTMGRFVGDRWEGLSTDRPIIAELLRQLAEQKQANEQLTKALANHAKLVVAAEKTLQDLRTLMSATALLEEALST